MVVDSLSVSSMNFVIQSAQSSEVIQKNPAKKRAAMIGCPQMICQYPRGLLWGLHD